MWLTAYSILHLLKLEHEKHSLVCCNVFVHSKLLQIYSCCRKVRCDESYGAQHAKAWKLFQCRSNSLGSVVPVNMTCTLIRERNLISN